MDDFTRLQAAAALTKFALASVPTTPTGAIGAGMESLAAQPSALPATPVLPTQKAEPKRQDIRRRFLGAVRNLASGGAGRFFSRHVNGAAPGEGN